MKEFRTKEGGRKIYNEDFANLQELITSISGFFSDCKRNFVISGCEVEDDRVKSGYVFLEGQIRKVDETKININESPVITPVTQVISERYEDGNADEIATIYDTKIVPLNKFTYGAGIVGVSDANATYKYKSIIDTFWDAYTIVKNSSFTQNMDVLTKFVGELFASNATLNKQGRSIELSGNSILLMENGNLNQKIEISDDGEISFIGKDGAVNLKINKNDETKETLGRVTSSTLKANTITAQTLMYNSDNVKDAFFTVEEYADTGWHNLIRVSTGEEIQGIKARSYLGIVYIQGTIPQDFFSNVSYSNNIPYLLSGYYYNILNTDVKLPDCIPSPSSEYINNFQVITPIYGTVGANVFLNKKSRTFFLVVPYSSNKVGDLSPATDEGIAMFSFPFFSLNGQQDAIRPAVLGIRGMRNDTDLFKFPDKSICPSVSWQYSSDIPVKLKSYTYSDRKYAYLKFNPDSYVLHINAFLIRTSYETDLTTGESSKGQYYIYPEVESISYYFCIFDENENISAIPVVVGGDGTYVQIDLRYITDPSVNQYDGSYSKDKAPLTGNDKWTSNGYDVSDLKSVPKTIKTNAKGLWYDKIVIKVKFKDTQYFRGWTETLNIFGMDTKFHLSLDTHIFWYQLSNGTTRKSCDLFILAGYTWEYYEYRIQRGGTHIYDYYSSEEKRMCKMSTLFGGDRRFEYCWSIDEGAEYLEKISAPDGYNQDFIYYTWSDKALKATSKFRISAHLAPSSNSEHDSKIKKAFIDINPNDVTLVRYGDTGISNNEP